MRKFIQGMANTRFVALIRKEFSQIRRDRRMTISLIVPPILMILFFGYVLNPIVKNLQLGVVDESRTPESRELIATLSESESFAVAGSYLSASSLDILKEEWVNLPAPRIEHRHQQRGSRTRSIRNSLQRAHSRHRFAIHLRPSLDRRKPHAQSGK